MLYDGRNKVQNGWFVLGSMIPAGVADTVVQWDLEVNTKKGWIRRPIICHSQVGYHPDQKKTAVIEFDRRDIPGRTADLLRISDDGACNTVFISELKSWGQYLRYQYFTFDFTSVRDSGLYLIRYDSSNTKPFIISKQVYEHTWQPTLDIYFPVQMDYMRVNEAYRVWHGTTHLDDARQAPAGHEHFDLYSQGPETDSPFKGGEHIPGLNIGGCFDAGDYDIRTQTQYSVILNLVQIRERFGIDRDKTFIDQKRRFVDIHHPDGVPDIMQQIEHGVLTMIAQHKPSVTPFTVSLFPLSISIHIWAMH